MCQLNVTPAVPIGVAGRGLASHEYAGQHDTRSCQHCAEQGSVSVEQALTAALHVCCSTLYAACWVQLLHNRQHQPGDPARTTAQCCLPRCCFHLLFCSISDDIGVNLTKLELVSAQNVPAFVPRLSVNKGLLPVRLKLSGEDSLPGSAAIQVGYGFSAMLSTRFI